MSLWDDLPDELNKINFSPNQKLPPNYHVVYDFNDEMYYWYVDENLYGWACCDRWQAYRSAWAHYKKHGGGK